MSYPTKSRLNSFPFLQYYSENLVVRDFPSTTNSPTSKRPRGGADMDVTGPGFLSGSKPVIPVSKTTPTPPPTQVSSTPAQPISTQDELEISTAGPMNTDETPPTDLRTQRLEQIKQAIQDGSYDTDQKLDFALGRLLDNVLDGDELPDLE